MKTFAGIRLLTVAFIVACGAALVSMSTLRRTAGAGHSPDKQRPKPVALSVAWRIQVGANAGRPCPVAGGWAVADGAGGVTKLTSEGFVKWRASFSNEVFAGAAEVAGGHVAAASESGRVYCLDGATGAVRWRRDTDARFQHAPLAGLRGAESVVWLVSQEDGRLFCLRVPDGTVVWTTEATNRCDGEPAVWPGRIAYGNCDGAVYVFDSFDGKPLGKVAVGEGDQMAGGMLVLDDGRLVTGTRSGNLVLVNPETLSVEASVKVSESEAFVTPVMCFWFRVAMGTEEGEVTALSRGSKLGSDICRFATGSAVKSLASVNDRLFALAGGTLFAFTLPDGEVGRLALGDDVVGLAVNAAGDLACLADGAVVCVKGGGR